jgi:hypothetical protein
MTHPEDRLADYVDGSLTPEERSVVDAHLASCEVCREEVALATTAFRSLRALPRTVGTPPEVGRDAIDEAAAPPGSPVHASRDDWSSEASPAAAPDHPRWYRWAGAAAGAAAVVLALAVAIPTLTGDDDGTGGTLAAEDSGGTAMTEAAASDIERIAGNLGPTDLPALAEPVREAVQDGAISAAAPTAQADAGGEGSGDSTLSEPTASPAADRRADAVACLRSAFPAVTDPPLRLVELRFQKTPAYGGVFFVPGGTETEVGTFEFDVLEVVVASRADCTLLSASPVRP